MHDERTQREEGAEDASAAHVRAARSSTMLSAAEARDRLLVACAFAAVVVITYFGITTLSYIGAGSVTFVVLCVAWCFAFATPLALQAKVPSKLVGGTLLGALAAAVCIVSIFNGGADSVALLWNLPLPIIAAGAFGARAGFAVAVALGVESMLLLALAHLGSSFPREFPAGPTPRFFAESVGALLIFMGGMTWLYEVTFRAFVGRLAHALEDRRQANAALRRARDQAQQATHAKTEFLATVTHELRTPLISIIGVSGLAAESATSEEQRRWAQAVRHTGRNLLYLVDDILELAQGRQGALAPKREPIDVLELMDALLSEHEANALAKGLVLVPDIPANLPHGLLGDRGRVEQVLSNLLLNALKFTQHGQIIASVRVISDTPEVADFEFVIQDTGIGIPLAEQELLFQPFSQVDHSLSRRYGGAGIGLAVCQELVHSMVGTMGVRSAPGDGSSFWVRLPFPKSPQKLARAPWDGSGMHLLLVDPWRPRADALAAHLRQVGAQVEVATSAEGIAALPVGGGQVPWTAVIARPELRGAVAQVSGTARRLACGGSPEPGWEKVPSPLFAARVCERLARAPVETAAPPEIAPPTDLPSPVHEGEKKHCGPQLQPRLLIAEDNPINQLLMTKLVEKLGFRVDVATTGPEAIAKAREEVYDAILMDCQMPELDGYEATVAIRMAEASGRRVPIVAVTAHSVPGDRDRCMHAGMDAYLTKPVTLDNLHRTLMELVQPVPADAPPSRRDAS